MTVAADGERRNGQHCDDERHREAMHDADRRERNRNAVEVLREQHAELETRKFGWFGPASIP
jgi:hypothetical protein